MNKALTYLLLALPAFAADPWKTNFSKWTEQDARRILAASPWAKPDRRTHAIVRWDSARPVQLAIERLDLKPAMNCYRTSYVIAVMGLAMAADSKQPEAVLRSPGRPPCTAVASEIREDAVYFVFPRTALREPTVFRLPGGLSIGNDVQFEARVGRYAIKQHFSLAHMTCFGRLEL